MKLSYHAYNEIQPKNSNGLTEIEERICDLYTTDPMCKGKKSESVLRAIYSPLLSNRTPKADLDIVANEVFSKKTIRKRIDTIIRERDGSFVFDRLEVLENYKALYGMAIEGDDDGPDIKTAKSINDSMAKVLGLFDDVKKQSVGTDPAKLAKAAYSRGVAEGRAKRAAMKPFEVVHLNKQKDGTDGQD